MRKDCYFGDFDGPGWPAPGDLQKYFLNGGRLWVSSGGNDNWGLEVQGLYGDRSSTAARIRQREFTHDGQP